MLVVDNRRSGVSALVAASALILLSAGFCATASETVGPYTDARAVQDLSPKEAAEGRTVHLRAVVIFVDMPFGRLFAQDKTAGIYIYADRSHIDKPLQVGDFISIDGVTTPGAYSPCVTKARIQWLGTRPLPTPEHANFEQFLSGGPDSNWAEVKGVVRSGEVRQGRLYLNVKIDGGFLIAILTTFQKDWSRSLVDSKVLISGAVAQIHYQQRQTIGVRLFVPPGFLRVIERAPDHPFRLPESSASAIRSYRKSTDYDHRIRVRGVVIGVRPGHSLYLEGKDGKLEIRGQPVCSVQAGDVVDVVGFPGSTEIRPALLDSICRTISTKSKTDPIPVDAGQVLLPQKASEGIFKYDFAASSRYDMTVVRIDGVLLQNSAGPEGRVLLLESGGKQFIGTLPGARETKMGSLAIGSHLQLTGVCLLGYDTYRRAESFRILLRSPTDVVVLKRAPWWNLENAMRALSVMAMVLAGVVFWVVRQTVQLRRANQTLKRLSLQDGLTGVGNRRAFDRALEAEMRRASRSSTPVSLIMLDIDYFKLLNDHHGHQRGDECLVLVASALRSVKMRMTDVVARYGGEEFGIILPGSDCDTAIPVAENIRQVIADLALVHEASPLKCVTVSAGIATIWPKRGTMGTSLIALADRALYKAKAGGKNQVCYESDLKESAQTNFPEPVSPLR